MMPMPRLTAYNASEVIEFVRARAFRLLMSEEMDGVKGPNTDALFDLVGDMTEAECETAISVFAEEPQ